MSENKWSLVFAVSKPTEMNMESLTKGPQPQITNKLKYRIDAHTHEIFVGVYMYVNAVRHETLHRSAVEVLCFT